MDALNPDRSSLRSKLRWKDCVRQDVALLGVEDPDSWMEMVQDRRWRLPIAAAKNHFSLQLQEYE